MQFHGYLLIRNIFLKLGPLEFSSETNRIITTVMKIQTFDRENKTLKNIKSSFNLREPSKSID